MRCAPSRRISRTLAATRRRRRSPLPAARRARKSRATTNRASTSGRPLHQLTGVDLSQIDGIGPYNALAAALGDRHRHEPLADREAFHLVADPGAPEQDLRRPPPQQPHAALRESRRGHLAHGGHELGRTQTALGAFYRRVAFRIGKAKAITATARKLAILVYRTLKEHLVYADPGADAYDAQHRTRVVRRLRQRPSISDLGSSTSRPAR